MKSSRALALLSAVLLIAVVSSRQKNPFAGRWDLTITPQGQYQKSYPDWMELVEQNANPVVRVQPRTGSMFQVKDVKIQGAHMTLGINRTVWDLDAQGDQVSGTIKRGDAVEAHIAGVRAPALKRKAPKSWSTPEPIFNGTDLTGWEPVDSAKNNWAAEEGVLVNKAKGANLRSTRKFGDFKLHIEYNCPEEGNSGIYLRGRYEIQVAYEKPGVNDKFHDMGAIYSFISPAVELPRKPGQWETFDVTLVGRMLTVLRNGVKTIDNQEIAGITGGALDSNEGEPGPFYLQGDHTGGMKYRNITVSVPK